MKSEVAFLFAYVLMGCATAAWFDYRWQARGCIATPLVVCLWPGVWVSVGLILFWHMIRNAVR